MKVKPSNNRRVIVDDSIVVIRTILKLKLICSQTENIFKFNPQNLTLVSF